MGDYFVKAMSVLKFYTGRCRCCLTYGYLRSLTQEYHNDYGERRIFNEMFLACFGLEMCALDTNPADCLICEFCIARLESCFKFRSQVDESRKNFHLLESNDWTYFDSETCQVVTYDVMQDSNINRTENLLLAGTSEVDKEACDISVNGKSEKIPFLWEKLWNNAQTIPKQSYKTSGSRRHTANGFMHGLEWDQFWVQEVKNCHQRKRLRKSSILPYRLEKGNLNCKVCGEKFQSALRLSCHMNIHYPHFICDKCGKGFASKNRILQHMMTHEKGKFTCKRCGKTCNSRNTLNMHEKMHIYNGKVYKCSICFTRYNSYVQRINHMYIEHGIERKRHSCTMCLTSCAKPWQLRVHIKKKHGLPR